MSRWLLLTVFSIAPLAFGCGSSVRPGLANAPRLGGAPIADVRITDVVSNGDDACGRYAEEGVLRNRIPPCRSRAATHPVAGYAVPTATGGESHGLVQPWVDHFYVGWPCPASASSQHRARGWSAADTTVAACAVP